MQIALKIFIAATFLFSTCLVKTSDPNVLMVEIVGVSDGDTVTAYFPIDGVEKRIRLATIDAPEFKQPFGKKSKKSLSDLVFRKKVTILTQNTDKYGRIVAELIVDDMNVNIEQLKRGYAWHYKFHAKSQNPEKRFKYAKAEKSAKEKRLGLWQNENPTPPWDFRRNGKDRNRNDNKILMSPVN